MTVVSFRKSRIAAREKVNSLFCLRLAHNFPGFFPVHQKGCRPMHVDEFDQTILREVQMNCRLTANQLSARVGLSPSAVQRRLDRLRQKGIIEREVAIVSPAAVGSMLSLIVEVSL